MAQPASSSCFVNGVWDKYQKKSPYGRWNNTNTNHKLFPMTICHGPGGKIIRTQTKNLYILKVLSSLFFVEEI